MRRIKPFVRLTSLSLVLLLLFAACSGGSDEASDDQAIADAGAADDATDATDDAAGDAITPEQRDQAGAETQTLSRGGDTSLNAPTQEGEARTLASIVEGGTLDVERIARSVVRVETALVEDGDFSIVAFGSGSIVDRRGLILTNFHVIDPAIGYDVILIAVTGALDERPREKFLARVQVADATLDLAVLRIVSDLSGQPV